MSLNAIVFRIKIHSLNEILLSYKFISLSLILFPVWLGEATYCCNWFCRNWKKSKIKTNLSQFTTEQISRHFFFFFHNFICAYGTRFITPRAFITIVWIFFKLIKKKKPKQFYVVYLFISGSFNSKARGYSNVGCADHNKIPFLFANNNNNKFVHLFIWFREK